jgi:hypothetical protein
MEAAAVLLGSLFGILGVISAISFSLGHRDCGLWTGCLAIVAATFAACCYLQDRHWKQDARASNVLTHGSGSTPPVEFLGKPVMPPDSAMIMFFGNAVAWTSTFPFSVIKQADEDVITINRNNDGIVISAKLFDRTGKIVCEIVDNAFHLNPNKLFRMDKPPHGLRVFNDEARCVLDIEFINERTVRFFGDFYLRNGLHVVMAPTQLLLGDGDYSGNIFGQSGSGAIRIP